MIINLCVLSKTLFCLLSMKIYENIFLFSSRIFSLAFMYSLIIHSKLLVNFWYEVGSKSSFYFTVRYAIFSMQFFEKAFLKTHLVKLGAYFRSWFTLWIWVRFWILHPPDLFYFTYPCAKTKLTTLGVQL